MMQVLTSSSNIDTSHNFSLSYIVTRHSAPCPTLSHVITSPYPTLLHKERFEYSSGRLSAI